MKRNKLGRGDNDFPFPYVILYRPPAARQEGSAVTARGRLKILRDTLSYLYAVCERV